MSAANYQSPIRDLIPKLDAVIVAHPAYPQVADFARHMRDHLSALARVEEVNQQCGEYKHKGYLR